MTLVLSLDECIRANASLIKAVQSSDVRALKDILAALCASDVRKDRTGGCWRATSWERANDTEIAQAFKKSEI